MTHFKKITGNFVQVSDAIGFHAGFYGHQVAESGDEGDIKGARDLYLYEIEKDSQRTSYAADDDNVADIKATLKDTTHLYNEATNKLIDEDKKLVYAQGSYDGGFFTDNYIRTHSRFRDNVGNGPEVGYIKSIRLNYIDDKGKNCGFSLCYLRDDSNVEIPLEKRKIFFVAAVIRNVHHALVDREVTFFAHSAFTEGTNMKGVSLRPKELPGELAKVINSKLISHAIEGIITGDTISLNCFNDLVKRARGDQNLDNRDILIEKLKDLLDMSLDYISIDLIREIEDRIKNDFDFFKVGSYEKNLNEIFEIIKRNVHEKEADKAKAEELIKKIELTFYAIRFELLAYPLTEEAKKEERTALLDMADRLRSAPSDSSLAKIIAEERIEGHIKEPIKPIAPIAPIAPEAPTEPKGLRQGFLRSHYGALTFGVGGLLTAGALLIMSGLFAPLGMAFAGVATIIVVAGAVVAGAVGLAGILKMVVDERRFGKEMALYLPAKKKFDVDTANYPIILNKYEDDKVQYETNMQQYDSDCEHNLKIHSLIKEAVALENVADRAVELDGSGMDVSASSAEPPPAPPIDPEKRDELNAFSQKGEAGVDVENAEQLEAKKVVNYEELIAVGLPEEVNPQALAVAQELIQKAQGSLKAADDIHVKMPGVMGSEESLQEESNPEEPTLPSPSNGIKAN
jgi:hypothetical protein